jgi:hypothetical protein
MSRAQAVTGILILIVAAIFVASALQLPLGTPNSPEPGLVPLIEAALLALAAIGLLTVGRENGARIAWPAGRGARTVLHVAAALVGYIALLEVVGYALSTFLFVFAAGHAWRRFSIPVLLASSLVISLLLFLTFSVFLQMPLPRSVVGLR